MTKKSPDLPPSQSFKSLKQEWDRRLAVSGFDDHEDGNGNLRQYDRRVHPFHDRENVLAFFLALDHFLERRKDLKYDYRVILELYASGTMEINEIVAVTGRSRKHVYNVIRRYTQGKL